MSMEKNAQWKSRIRQLLQVCQNEIKRTTQIGKRMFYATRANSDLHDAYQELGQLAAKELKAGKLKWRNTRVKELVDIIQSFEKSLESMEDEVGQIKSSSLEKSLPSSPIRPVSQRATKDN